MPGVGEGLALDEFVDAGTRPRRWGQTSRCWDVVELPTGTMESIARDVRGVDARELLNLSRRLSACMAASVGPINRARYGRRVRWAAAPRESGTKCSDRCVGGDSGRGAGSVSTRRARRTSHRRMRERHDAPQDRARAHRDSPSRRAISHGSWAGVRRPQASTCACCGSWERSRRRGAGM